MLDSTNVLIQTSTTNEKQLTEAALGAVQTTNVAVKELVPVEQNLATVATDVHKLVSDPSNQKTLANIQTATAAGAETAKRRSGMDTQSASPYVAAQKVVPHRISGFSTRV